MATATLTTGAATDVTDQAMWSSSTSAVASVSPAGRVTAIAVGETDIRATFGGVVGGARLMVVALASSRPASPRELRVSVDVTTRTLTAEWPEVETATSYSVEVGSSAGSADVATRTAYEAAITYGQSCRPAAPAGR